MSQLQRIIDLQKLLLAFGNVDRTFILPPVKNKAERNETDVEHSYGLAMAAWYLTRQLPHLDTDTCIRYALVHDLVEIQAGDTFLYDKNQEAHASKPERERQALCALQREWPDFPELTDSLRAYEERQSAESKFVYALDKLMPMIINHLSKGRNYRALGITLADVQQAKSKKIAVSPEVAELYNELIGIFEANPAYFPAATNP